MGAAGGRELLRAMDGHRTNLALLVVVLLATATGALNFALGTGWVRWPTTAHGGVGLAAVVLSWWKVRIARRGLERRAVTATWPSLLLAVLVVTAVVSGVLHATGTVLQYGPLDDMQVHVGAALLSLPLLGWHVVDHGTWPRARDLTRRNLLRSMLLVGSAGALWGAVEAVNEFAGLPGRQRRATGSFEEGSHDPAAMPSIIWLFDPRLDLDADDWEVAVSNQGARRLSYQDVTAPQVTRTAVLDCTSGWWAEQDWTGAPVADLLGPVRDGARSLLVRSATGYSRRFPLRDVPHLLLATAYEGRPLAPRHGFPARLVAPGRRGFWWVKWVTHLEVSDVPWWRQSPYPTQ